MTLDSVDHKILWIGTYPAHYMRKMHCEVERAKPGAMHFIYIPYSDQSSRMAYERGSLPESCDVLDAEESLAKFYGLLRKHNPRALIISGYSSRFLVCAHVWAWLNRRKYMYYSDTNFLDVMQNKFVLRSAKWIVLRLVLGRTHKLLYVGSRNRDFYIWLLGRSRVSDKLYMLPLPAILGKRPDETKVRDRHESFKILYLGRLEPEKGIEKLLRSTALLSPAIKSSLRVSIVGDGSEAEHLKELSRNLKISNVVEFHGSLASDEVDGAYHEADLFVLPSEKEPWGLVVNEALSAGLPVMCPYWVGSAADLVIDGITGFLLDSNAPESIARGIEIAFGQRDTLQIMGSNGARHVNNGPWHSAAAIEKLVALIENVLAIG